MRITSTLLALASAGALTAAAAGQTLPALAQAATPATLYVSASGKASNPGTAKAPLASIQAAASKAAAGTTIVVLPGTYHEMVTVTKRLTIESAPGTGTPESTVIDAKGLANGILIKGNAASGTTIRGLTIEDANDAGVLAVGPISRLTFAGNVLTANSQVKPPKSIGDWETLHLMSATDSKIVNNLVVDNLDGGIYLTDEFGPNAHNLVKGNVVVGNQVDCGITLASHAKGHGVYDNTVEDNLSEYNGAAGVILATAVPGGIVRDNLVKNNTVKFNGLGGIGLHTHLPGSVVAGNRIIANTVAGNAPDFGVTTVPTGIDVGAVGSPITGTIIKGNIVNNEVDGINLTSLAKNTAIAGNTDHAAVPVTHTTPPPAPPSKKTNR